MNTAQNVQSQTPVARKTKRQAKTAAEKAASVAKDAATTVSAKADALAEDAISKTRSTADAYAQRGVNKTEDVIRSLGRAIEAGSDSLEQDGMNRTAAYVRAAANGLDKAAAEVDGFNPSHTTSRVENVVRNNPLLTVGALALAGFALAGAMKNKQSA